MHVEGTCHCLWFLLDNLQGTRSFMEGRCDTSQKWASEPANQDGCFVHAWDVQGDQLLGFDRRGNAMGHGKPCWFHLSQAGACHKSEDVSSEAFVCSCHKPRGIIWTATTYVHTNAQNHQNNRTKTSNSDSSNNNHYKNNPIDPYPGIFVGCELVNPPFSSIFIIPRYALSGTAWWGWEKGEEKLLFSALDTEGSGATLGPA